MNTGKLQHIYFFSLCAVTMVVMYFIFEPFVAPLLLALICAVAFKDVHVYTLQHITRQPRIAAALSVLSVLLFIVVPLVVLGVLVFNEARDFYASFSTSSSPAGLLNQGLQNIERSIRVYVPQANINLESYVQAGLQWVLGHTSAFFSSFMKVILQLFIMIIALFYLFLDGSHLKDRFIVLSPLDKADDEDILKKLALTINSVIRGTLIIAVIQGSCTALGLYLFGISQPLLWGLVAAVASLVPGVGTALVHIPAVLYLVITGNMYGAIGYVLWGGLLIGSIDNVISPFLIERKVKIHPLLILVSVLGGLAFFGPIGFLAGPVVLAFATELFKLFPKFTGRSHV